ncbi:acetyl-CoA carboxylase, carboxyltransferase subunit beta [Mesoterricola silvestris]|uniref:Acetyl-coenzyme A carboxylase carboxyl transferase subunit beta n=1 Tax=Mesoterricola silvestris TaxID=2927979 RepID=A0AA48HAZ6_9BACT|nr:acetyl-CoA carboxylase, carboxyltransferase subunit beta [Mesoterricola silvestris]BDU74988.1 acetyl-coenzyme A carboxylase carboxyl transferase subunit beta [Mesoterricola silvestris]
MSWFIKKRQQKTAVEERTVRVPEGLWVKCDACRELIYRAELANTRNVCPKCGYHFRIGVAERLESVMDPGYEERFGELQSGDPLAFSAAKPYADQLRKLKGLGHDHDAVLVVEGTLKGHPVVMGVMDWDFLAASMGSVVGEKLRLGAELALAKGCAFIIVSCSGGARMQEGALSLMQMAKVSAALARLDSAGLPYLSILTDPTTGGVSASYAMLGDLNIAEPKALIGFAGPRVIEQTIKQTLPEGFQRSEFLQSHGMVDKVVPRDRLRDFVATALDWMTEPHG